MFRAWPGKRIKTCSLINAAASGAVYPNPCRTTACLHCPAAHCQSGIEACFLRQRSAILRGIATAQPAEQNDVAQLDDVHSVLIVSYETLKRLNSLALARVSKLTFLGRYRRP